MNGLIKMAALAALLASMPAMSQQDPAATAGGGGDFKTLDTNGDGSLSQDEVKADATLSAEFSKLDTDHDGKLSNSEFAKAKGMGDKDKKQY